MQKYDAQTLAQNLNALAEVFDRKPVSVKALEVWFDSLKEFPTERVMGLLIAWPKSHGKFPAPSEVWKACNESLIDEREEKAARERKENMIAPRWPKTPHASECLRRMALIFKRPKTTAREHWETLLRDAPRGSLARRTAEEILKKRVVEREPGQDDEELAA